MIDQDVRKRLHELGGVEIPTPREKFIRDVKEGAKEVGFYFLICIGIVQCLVMALFGKSCK